MVLARVSFLVARAASYAVRPGFTVATNDRRHRRSEV